MLAIFDIVCQKNILTNSTLDRLCSAAATRSPNGPILPIAADHESNLLIHCPDRRNYGVAILLAVHIWLKWQIAFLPMLLKLVWLSFFAKTTLWYVPMTAGRPFLAGAPLLLAHAILAMQVSGQTRRGRTFLSSLLILLACIATLYQSSRVCTREFARISNSALNVRCSFSSFLPTA